MLLTGILYLLTVLKFVEAARILCLYPVAYVSHQMVLRKITEELAKQGHELVVMTPLPHDKPIENVTEIDVYDITFPVTDEAIDNILTQHVSSNLDNTFWPSIYFNTTIAQFTSSAMQSLLNDESQHFDLILIEACAHPALLAGARFKVPVALVSSMSTSYENFELVGAEVNPIYFPDYNINRKFWELSFFNKISLLLEHAKMLLINLSLRKTDHNITKIILGKDAPPFGVLMESVKMLLVNVHPIWDGNRAVPPAVVFMKGLNFVTPAPLPQTDHNITKIILGKDAPPLGVLMESVKMLLVNVHPIWDGNRAVPPAVVFMKGLNFVTPAPLPQDLEIFLNDSPHGVIYMSQGSKQKTSHLPAHIIEIMLKVFASLPYDILWKWDGEQLHNKPKNVRLEKWLPQNDLLHHPKVKAFITHSGLQSTDEAIAAEVPLIGLPILGDQWRNSHQYQKFGIGVQLNLYELNEKEFRKAIIDVAENKSYRENIGRLSRVMRERRGRGALSAAVRTLEHLAAGSARLLHPPLADVTFIEFYLLDLLAVAICVSLSLIAILVLIVRIL